MKKYMIVSAAVLTLISCSGVQSTDNDSKIIAGVESATQTTKVINKVVSKSEFKELMKKEGAQVIDVRTADECKGGTIEKSKNIDFYSSDFKEKMSKLDKSKPVLVYCKSGGRSGQTAAMLKDLGFKEVYDLEGGYSSWK